MSKKNNPITLDPFQAWCHRWGRIGTLLALVYMVSLPFIFLSVYDCVPSLGEVFNVATIGILAIYIPVGFSEALSYTPLMGASSYLGFITGNIHPEVPQHKGRGETGAAETGLNIDPVFLFDQICLLLRLSRQAEGEFSHGSGILNRGDQQIQQKSGDHSE